MKSLIFVVSLLCTFYLFHGALGDTLLEEIQERTIINPDHVYYNQRRQKVVIPEGSGDDENHALEVRYEVSKCHSYCKQEKTYEAFARRLINMLIARSRLKIDAGKATGSINLEASLDELEILKGFGGGKMSMRQLDGIIDNVIKQPEVNLFDEIFSYTDMLCFYLYEHRRTFLSILFCMIVIPIVVKGTRTKMGIAALLFSVTTIISFIMTWQQLIQDAEIKITALRDMYYKRPEECSYMNLGFFGSAKLFLGIGKGDCLKYYEVMMKDPMLEVTPTQAFIHMCTKAVSYPVLLFGKEFTQFVDITTDSLPFWIQPIAKPLVYFITLLLIYGLLFIVVGGKFGIRIGPLFHFYIHGRESSQPSIGVTPGNRQAIEIIQSDTQTLVNETQVQSREVSQAQTQTVSTLPAENKSPRKTSEKSTQVKETEPKKQEESDSNSDEYLEDGEYEKISKKRIESEMNRTRIEVLEIESSTKKDGESESEPKSEQSSEIGSDKS